MTCIVGLVEKEKVYIGADSCGTCGYDMVIRRDPKVFVLANKFVIGGAGSFRMIQILNFSFKPPPIRKGLGIYEYMCTDFINELRKVYKENGFISFKNERERGGLFLVGVGGRLFTVEDDFQIGESNESFHSIGSGDAYALGVLHATKGSKLPPNQKILDSLQIASYYTANVRPPFTIKMV